MSKCFWCGADPNEELPNDLSPHSTWCPHYRAPRSVPRALNMQRELERMRDAESYWNDWHIIFNWSNLT